MKQSVGERTRERILKAGLKLWPDVTPSSIAQELNMTHPAIIYHFPYGLKGAVADYAVEKGHSKVIVQLVVWRHKAIKKLSASERIRHFKSI